jgi:hypothetical protein
VDKRTGQETSVSGQIRFGGSFGDEFRWRPEFVAGYREIASGSPGDTTAHFVGGNSFTLQPASLEKGGAYAQFGISAGTELYEFSFTAGAEARKGYQEGDAHVRVRLLF